MGGWWRELSCCLVDSRTRYTFRALPLTLPLLPAAPQDIPGGHPYMLSLGILGGIYAFENPLQGCLLVRRAGGWGPAGSGWLAACCCS